MECVLGLFHQKNPLLQPTPDEIETLKVEQTRLTLQCTDAQRREKILMRRLANKEQEFQDYVVRYIFKSLCHRILY